MLGIYCRISRYKEDGKDRSIPEQILLGKEFAEKKNYDYELFVDEGISAASDNIKDRPEFVRLLEKISNGEITAVYAIDQSRFERNPHVRFTINKTFKKHDIKYFTLLDGEVDLHDPQAEFFGDLLSVINKFQVTMTAIKVKGVINRRVTNGKAHGISPYGYGRDSNGMLIINDEEAEIVRLVFELSLKGMGTRSIGNFLTDKKIPTRYNKIAKGTMKIKNRYTNKITFRNKVDIIWAGNTIRGILTNPIYYGKRKFGKNIYDVPAIIDETYWKKVNDNFKNNSNNKGRKVAHAYLLKGLVRCGFCSRNMYGRTRVSKKDNYYMCSSKRIKQETCTNRSINIDRMDSFVWGILFGQDNFIKRLESEIFDDAEEKQNTISEISNERKKLEGLKLEKQKTISLCAKGIFPEEELPGTLLLLNAEIYKVDMNLKTLEDKERTINEGKRKLEEIKNEFIDYTNITHFTQKVKVINEVVSNIIVKFISYSHYEVTIEYKFGLPSEVWKTTNPHANLFYKTIYDKDGNFLDFKFKAPNPVNNPNDDSTFKSFFKYEGLLSKF